MDTPEANVPKEDLGKRLRRKSNALGNIILVIELLTKLFVYIVLSALLAIALFHDRESPYAWWSIIIGFPVFMIAIIASVILIHSQKGDIPRQVLYLARLVEGMEADSERPYESGPITNVIVWLMGSMSNIIAGPFEVTLEVLGGRFSALRGMSSRVVFYWLTLLVAIDYLLETHGAKNLPIVLSTFLIATFLYRSTVHLTMKNGLVRMLRLNAKPIFPSHIMIYALLMACTFGVVYMHLSMPPLNGFEHSLNVGDAIYFSVITLATVGYGDIHPVSSAAKWVCIFEVIFGLMMLVIALNATMTLWLQNAKKEEMAAWKKEQVAKADAEYKDGIAWAEHLIKVSEHPSSDGDVGNLVNTQKE